jgi:hypothetical protein
VTTSSSSSKPSAWSPWSWLSEFVQPINPGWTFGNLTINEENSSAPDTERAILLKESYGRQLGRVIDALAVLVAERPDWRETPAFEAFIDLRDGIEKIKSASAASRLDRIAADLAELRNSDQAEFKRAVQKLKKALDDAD